MDELFDFILDSTFTALSHLMHTLHLKRSEFFLYFISNNSTVRIDVVADCLVFEEFKSLFLNLPVKLF